MRYENTLTRYVSKQMKVSITTEIYVIVFFSQIMIYWWEAARQNICNYFLQLDTTEMKSRTHLKLFDPDMFTPILSKFIWDVRAYFIIFQREFIH